MTARVCQFLLALVVTCASVAQTTAPAAIDFSRARELLQKSNNGEQLTPDEKDYLARARAEIAAGRGPGAAGRADANRPDGQRPPIAPAAPNIPTTGPYAITREIKVGGEGLWGKMILDPRSQFLYIPRQGKVQVLDLAAAKIVAEIPIKGMPLALAIVPDANRGFITCHKENALTVFDLKTNTVLGSIPVGDEPSDICYDAPSKHLFIACSGNKTLVPLDPGIDLKTGKPGSPIDLGGKPTSLAADENNTLFATLEETSELALIDTREMRLLAKWPLARDRGPGMLENLSFDPHKNCLYVADRAQRLLVISAVDGHQVAELPVNVGAQATAFNASHAFAACADGTLDVLAQSPDGKFEWIQSLKIGLPRRVLGVPSIAVDPKTGALYIPAIDTETTPDGNPRPVRDSFKILVIEKK